MSIAQNTPCALSVSHLSVAFQQHAVLHEFSLQVDQGDIVCLLGPSGCGKTTALKAIAGLQITQSGSIDILGKTVADGRFNLPTQQRNIGFIFQDYALFPHLSVADNIGYGLRTLGKAEQQQRIQDMLSLVELDEYAKRYPHELSGGQQQRIALARALAPQPELLLMDEPFSNIDSQVKRRMMSELRHLIKRSGVTAIFVTHAKDEAFVFADKTAVMMNGQIQQYGTPADVFNTPSNCDVARFMEAGNLCQHHDLEWLFDQPSTQDQGDKYALFKRHQLVIEPSTDGPATVSDIQFNGRGYLIDLSFTGQSINNWQVETDQTPNCRQGERVKLSYTDEPVSL